MRTDCYFCHIKTIQKLIEKFQPTNSVAEEFILSVHEIMRNDKEIINPKLATAIQRLAKEKLSIKDLYVNEKVSANNLLLKEYSYWRKYIDSSQHPFRMAVKLAVVGNIIDYGAHSLNGNLKDQIAELATKELRMNESDKLELAIQQANNILYLGDNAGEIFFDRLLIETIAHANVTFVTRGTPVINDITLEDARQIGVDKLCKVIDNGFDAPSTLLDSCSSEFLEAYRHADLIISKGMGNFEGLMNEKHPNTFFLLMAKCKPIAELIGCDINDMIVTKLDIEENAI